MSVIIIGFSELFPTKIHPIKIEAKELPNDNINSLIPK